MSNTSIGGTLAARLSTVWVGLLLLTLHAGTPPVRFEGPKTFDGRIGTVERLEGVPKLGDFTFTAWVKVTGDGDGDKPFARLVDGPGFYFHVVTALRKGAANSALAGNCRDFFGFTLGIPVPGGKVSAWTSGPLTKPGQWVHVALQVPGGGETLPKLFVNGMPAGLFCDKRARPALLAGGTYGIGNGLGGRRPFEGALAAVEIAPCLLPETEIAARAAKDPDGNPPRANAETFADELPIADISHDAARQTVIAAGTPELYQGHPTTLLAADGKTMFCAWTVNHGGGCGPFAKSVDGGRSWTRLDDLMPADYRFHRNCPTLQTVPRPDGSGVNYCVFSANCKPGTGGGLGILMSRDEGRSWWVTPPATHLSAGMPPTGLMPLKDGSCALFGQVRKGGVKTDRPVDDQSVWMSVSKDGGFTWGPARVVATAENKNLCEPFAIRSPDGSEIALLIRENRHTARSMMVFSRDEGKTWTEPVDTCWGLTGDRHEGLVLPDGRLVIAFRDQALRSSTWGQYMAWVGTWDDLRNARPGQYRIHLLEHQGGRRPTGGYRSGDTGYSGVERLPDGTLVCTTYTKHWADARRHSVVSTRFRIEETDAMVKTLPCRRPGVVGE